MTRHSGTRAMPPRPSLLAAEVGDLEGIKLVWQDLRMDAEHQLQEVYGCTDFYTVTGSEQGCGHAEPQKWDSLCRRFRSLRETLCASDILDDLARQVYEMSVDVCLAANNLPEFLKSAQVLVMDLYPRQQRQQVSGSQVTACAPRLTTLQLPDAFDVGSQSSVLVSDQLALLTLGPAEGSPESSCTPDVCQHLPFSRVAEMFACLLVFFEVVRSSPTHADTVQIFNVCYRIDQQLFSSTPLRFALAAIRARKAADPFALCKLVHDAPTTSLQLLLRPKLHEFQQQAVKVMSNAFRSLPWYTAVDMLNLNQHSQHQPSPSPEGDSDSSLQSALCRVLRLAEQSGCKGAQVALSALSGWHCEGGALTDVPFK